MQVPLRSAGGPAQVGLASWLGGGSVFIVLLAVAAIALACAILLSRLVEQQGLVRAQLAAASGRELLRRAGEDVLTDARVLAERPPLQRLIDTEERDGLEAFLRRFADSSGLAVAALLRGPELLAQSGPAVDWPEIERAEQEQGERFVLAPRNGGPVVWGAAAPLAGGDVRVVTLKLATPDVLAALGTQVGAALQVVNFATYHAPAADAFTPLHTQALSGVGGTAAGMLEQGRAYAASTVLAAQTGEVVGLLDATIDGTEFATSIRRFDRILSLSALVVAAIAGLAGVFYGRWLARPVIALRDVAERIGHGDFSTAMPAIAPRELAGLARSMDEMRRNLVELTDTLRRREAEAQAVLSGVVEGVYAVDQDRRIRYANAQVATLLARQPGDIIGQFCGDVLYAGTAPSDRPCERDCPILAARHSPQSRARDPAAARRQHALGDHRQRPAGTRRAGADSARRDRPGGGPARPRRRARQHLARVSHAARRAAGGDRTVARRAGRHEPGGAARAARQRRARRAAPDAADRQSARERAHRIRPALDPRAGGRPARGRRGGLRTDRPTARAARAGGRDRPRRHRYHRAGRSAAPGPGVREPAVQRCQVCPGGQHDPYRRPSARRTDRVVGRGRGTGRARQQRRGDLRALSARPRHRAGGSRARARTVDRQIHPRTPWRIDPRRAHRRARTRFVLCLPLATGANGP